MNSTIKKFGYSENLIKEYDYWVVLYRPCQVTIGSLVLICKENKFNLGDLSKSAYIEFKLVIQHIEKFLHKKYWLQYFFSFTFPPFTTKLTSKQPRDSQCI